MARAGKERYSNVKGKEVVKAERSVNGTRRSFCV